MPRQRRTAVFVRMSWIRKSPGESMRVNPTSALTSRSRSTSTTLRDVAARSPAGRPPRAAGSPGRSRGSGWENTPTPAL